MPSIERATASIVVRQPTAHVVQDQALWRQVRRIGGALTPADVSNIFREADGGDVSRQCDLANEFRQKDGHLHSCLSKMELAVAGLPWAVVPPDKATKKELKACERIQAWLNELPMAKAFAHHMGANYYGHAVSEPTYAKEGAFIVPKGFNFVQPRRFGYRLADGAFVFLPNENFGGTSEGSVLSEEHPGRFIESHPRVTGDVGPREGLVRVLMWAALFRNWAISDWLRLAEMAWKPWRIGKHEPSANQETIDSLVTVLDDMSSSGVLVHRTDCEVELKFPENGASNPQNNHQTLHDTLGREMSKAVLGGTETVESSKASGYAQSKTHESGEDRLTEYRAKAIADDFTHGLILPLTAMNFAGCRPGRLLLITKDTADLETFSKAIQQFKEAGVPMPLSWIRDEAGIPEPVGEEDVIGGPEDPNNPDETKDEQKPGEEEPKGEAVDDEAA